DVARAYRSRRANRYARGELSGRVEGARIHRDACTKVASGPALEAAASDDDARQTLPLSAGIGIDRVHRGRRSWTTHGYREPVGQCSALAVGIGDGDVARAHR